MARQLGRLLAWLEEHESITCWQAHESLGIERLSERVRELEELGVAIRHEHQVPVSNRLGEAAHVTVYHLINSIMVPFG